MPDALVIRLPARANYPVEWVRISATDGSSSAVMQGQLATAAELAAACKVLVLAPASQVLRVSVPIPLSGAARIRQSLPYALEEQLAGDVDEQHFACGAKDAQGYVPAAVVERVRLERWLADLREQQLLPIGVYAESDALPGSPAAMTVLIDQEQAIIRSASGELTTVDELSLQPTLELLLDQQLEALANDATVVPVNLLVYCDRATHERYPKLWDGLRMRVQDVDVRILESGALPLLAIQIASKGGVNLLQGPFAPKSELPLRWQEWRVAALLLAAVLVLNLVLKATEFIQLSRANDALDSAAAEILQRAFPEAADAPDPWTELRTRLGADKSGGTTGNAAFPEALDTLAGAFAETPDIKMESLSFRSGELSLQFTAPDVAALDKLRQLIVDQGRFTAEIQSANPDDDVVKGRIVIAETTGEG